MHIYKTHRFLKRAMAVISASVLIISTSVTAMAADSTYKFSDIDLEVTIPEELICFTRSTTNNNAYLDKIGVDDAASLRASMQAANVYLEAVNKDITYELVVSSQPASKELPDFNNTDSQQLNKLFNEYIERYKHIEADAFTEDITDSEITQHNGVYYFQTDITNISKTKVTVYSRKYYTVMQGNVYTFSIQSKTNQLDNTMTKQLTEIVQSAKYAPVSKSIFENNIVTELLSSIITLGLPIGALALIAYLLNRTKKKSAKQIAAEEKRLKENMRR
ncbi:MAG: hypothetical protein Q4F11_08900 [Eubacteriales bacterium]|nr:hypothetical protein [Eubacteriales bacterium]